MELIQNVIEYYDELYPVTEAQKKFYADLMKSYQIPVKFLRVGCGTGYFEHLLARDGHDVTGLETSKEMLESANLKRRNQLMSIRFFLMSSLDMTRFLGKNFYNIISCLNNRISFIHDRTLMRKFFFDCKELLAPEGMTVLQFENYAVYNTMPMSKLPTRESIRAKLYTELWTKDNGAKYISQEVETGNGKVLPVLQDELIYPLTKQEVIDFSKEAGFTKATFYSDFEENPFTGSEPEIIVVLR
jgi:2-polyprenyl-3-methyl-5-hydroxy-6-metoxy-1,4-benzoquinol methylase